MGVRGGTPDLFYGSYVTTEGPGGEPGRLIRRSGLVDCLSVFGSKTMVDANTADPAVLHALGMPDSGIQALVAQRNNKQLDTGNIGYMIQRVVVATALLHTVSTTT